MTGRTHDLTAFTALSLLVATQPIATMTLATAFVAFSANMIGGLAPDIDQSTGALWKRVRLGSFLGRLLSPIFGGHRHISHSILGIIFFAVISKLFLILISNVLIVDIEVVWWAFMIGVISHLIADSFTYSGVPWLFPIPIKFGVPPIKAFRFHTGSFIEKGIVFPGLILVNMYIFYVYHREIIDFLKTNIK
ncbi:MAG: metal-dependent hydrolase [Candidatus Levybacteria bacterium]|nr:metal-dependent hydrolase [Candidatus Levybacteria bacterium]